MAKPVAKLPWDKDLIEAVTGHCSAREYIVASGFSGVMQDMLMGKFVAISAERGDCTNEMNARRMKQLKRLTAGQNPGPALPSCTRPPKPPDIVGDPLAIGRHAFVAGRWVYFGLPERSLFIPGMDEETARAVAKYFGQESYVYGDGASGNYRIQPTEGGEPFLSGKISEDLDILKETETPAEGRVTKYPEGARQREVKDIKYRRMLERIKNAREIYLYLRGLGMQPPYTANQINDASEKLRHKTTPGGGLPKDTGAGIGYSLTDGRKWVFRPGDDKKTSSSGWEDAYLYAVCKGVKANPGWGVWKFHDDPIRSLLRNAQMDIQAENLELMVPIRLEPRILSSSVNYRRLKPAASGATPC